MDRRDAYYKHFVGESLEESAHLSLRAIGALQRFKDKSWNASTRGVLDVTSDILCRIWSCAPDTVALVLRELTQPALPVLKREDIGDGTMRLSYPPFTIDADLSATRTSAGIASGAKRAADASKIPRKNRVIEQNANKTVAMAMAMESTVLSATRGGVGENGDSADPPPSLDESVPLETRVRQWLNGMKRFPMFNTPPKHVSDVTKAVEKWGFDFVGECIKIAIDNNSAVPVPYAMSVAERRAGRRFAEQPKPIKSAGHGSRKTFKPG